MLRKAIAGIALAALTALSSGPAAAEGEKLIGPFYNPATKSYFGLVDSVNAGRTWGESARAASKRWYGGVPGRLAVVPDRETHDFILDKFGRHFRDDTWIGLRYFCSFRKLMWTNGKVMENSPAGVWSPQWFRNAETACGGIQPQTYMPVYYVGTVGYPLWQASGQPKRFYDYLIEFPTGKP